MTTLFSCIFSRTAWISLHQRGKINRNFNEPRDDGIAVAAAGSYADYLQLLATIFLSLFLSIAKRWAGNWKEHF